MKKVAPLPVPWVDLSGLAAGMLCVNGDAVSRAGWAGCRAECKLAGGC